MSPRIKSAARPLHKHNPHATTLTWLTNTPNTMITLNTHKNQRKSTIKNDSSCFRNFIITSYAEIFVVEGKNNTMHSSCDITRARNT